MPESGVTDDILPKAPRTGGGTRTVADYRSQPETAADSSSVRASTALPLPAPLAAYIAPSAARSSPCAADSRCAAASAASP